MTDNDQSHSFSEARDFAMSDETLLICLQRIENKLDSLVRQQEIKDFYSTNDLARIMDRAEFTVRQWRRLGRIKAEKRACGRGLTKEWMVSHQELTRLRSEGLLPERRW